MPVKEYQIVEYFLGSALKDEVMKIMPVQKQTRAGQRTRFKVGGGLQAAAAAAVDGRQQLAAAGRWRGRGSCCHKGALAAAAATGFCSTVQHIVDPVLC
jgi:hypothetical protein